VQRFEILALVLALCLIIAAIVALFTGRLPF